MKNRILRTVVIIGLTILSATAYAHRWHKPNRGVVTITPLGSNAGEFCGSDRALLFEDPSGVNILIQPGRTVKGAEDVRLDGIDVHVILLDHAHVDHMGDRIDVDADDVVGNGCSITPGDSLAPNPNIAEIAYKKNSAVLVGGELVPWLTNRVQAFGDAAVGNCGFAKATTVGSGTPCVGFLRPGAVRELVLDGEPTGVRVSTVQATHSNGISPDFIDGGDFGKGITGYGGTENGYVIRFSNGLSVYWSGDSGFFGDMKLFSRFYDVNLAVIHIGNIFTMGPDEAAFAVNRLIEPRSVIPTHANEGATVGGIVQTGTRTRRFIDKVDRAKVFVPLSGVPIYCNGRGRCNQ